MIKTALKLSRFRDGIEEHSYLNPLIAALIIVFVYVILVLAYIFLSSSIAASLSLSIKNLKYLELLKGTIYTLVTGFILFLGAFSALKKIAKLDERIISQNKRIISTERLVLAGLFSSSVCHDINNIMTVVFGNLELLAISKNIDREDRDLISQIWSASDRLSNLVKRMMEAGKNYVPGKRSQENLSRIIQDTVDFARVHRTIKSCDVQLEIEPDVILPVNSLLVSRTLMNLILNAAEATDGKGKILVRLRRKENFAGIEVHDDGPGINDAIKEKILEPFFTSKKDGNGLGLLSLKICLQQHAGQVTIDRSYLGGACFCLDLPANAIESLDSSPDSLSGLTFGDNPD